MKIKSIRKTNLFKEVSFSMLLDNKDNQKILTPSGFTRVLSFQKIKRGPTVRIETKYGVIECDPMHRVLTDLGELFVKDLQSQHKIIGYKNERLDFRKSIGGIQDLYDITIDSPHWYYTSGIVSHNSILLVNNGVSCILRGLNVLHVTLELSKQKTSQRYLGCFTDEKINNRFDSKVKERMLQRIQKIKTACDKHLIIDEYPPNDITTDVIHARLDHLKRVEGRKVDVVIVDYLELLAPRDSKYDNDYSMQKYVAYDLCRLAKKENVLVFSAMQTNRGGNFNRGNFKSGDSNKGSSVIGIDKVAESYGKTMPVDYIISINKDNERVCKDADQDNFLFWIVKNRNGPQGDNSGAINAHVNYETMKVREHSGG